MQSEPPSDHETYVHRSGRTWRAGAKGRSFTLSTPKHVRWLNQISHKAKVQFVTLGRPQPGHLLSKAVDNVIDAVNAIEQVDFMPLMDAARTLIASSSNGIEKTGNAFRRQERSRRAGPIENRVSGFGTCR